LTLVSADTGEILYRRISPPKSAITCRVYTQCSPTPLLPGCVRARTAQPAPVERGLVTFSRDDTASPNGWINDGDNETRATMWTRTSTATTTTSPICRVQPATRRACSIPAGFDHRSRELRRAATVQLFYWDN